MYLCFLCLCFRALVFSCVCVFVFCVGCCFDLSFKVVLVLWCCRLLRGLFILFYVYFFIFFVLPVLSEQEGRQHSNKKMNFRYSSK